MCLLFGGSTVLKLYCVINTESPFSEVPLYLLHCYSIITELENFCPEIAKSTDENGDTSLHLACSYGFVEVAERLIKGGADIEARY